MYFRTEIIMKKINSRRLLIINREFKRRIYEKI